MWKICKILKSVKNAPSLYNYATSNAVCSSDNSKDDEEEKNPVVDKIVHQLSNKASFTNEQLFRRLNHDSAFFLNYFSGVRILPVCDLKPLNDCHDETGSAIKPKLLTKEISTQTETQKVRKQSPIENLSLSEEAQNFNASTNELLGSFRNLVGLSLIRKNLYPEAYEHFRQAATIYKHPGAMYNLGLCFHKGYGVNKDNIKAMQLWMQAAEEGHNKAQYQVAVGYMRGIGNLPKDKDSAMKFLYKSRWSENPPSEAIVLYDAWMSKYNKKIEFAIDS